MTGKVQLRKPKSPTLFTQLKEKIVCICGFRSVAKKSGDQSALPIAAES